MQVKTTRIAFGVVVAAAAALFGGAANAGFYGSHYDPDFFFGDGVFFIPDAPSPCLGLGAGIHAVNPGDEGCDGVALVSAAVTATSGSDSAQLSFSGSSSDIQAIVLDFEEPLLVGVNSGLIPLTVDNCTPGLCGFNWFIEWVSGIQTPGSETPSFASVLFDDSGPLDGLNNQVFLFQQTCEIEARCSLNTFSGGPATNVSFAQVPEPGTLALIVGGLGLGWLTRKRKTAA